MRISSTLKVILAAAVCTVQLQMAVPASAQQIQRHYQYISPSGGKEIFEIFGAPFQDRYGVVWLSSAGTAGWCDGNAFHPINTYAEDSEKPMDGLVINYFEDEQGNLWAGGPVFLSKLDRATGSFKTIFRLQGEYIAASFLHVSFLATTSPKDTTFRTVSLDLKAGKIVPVSIKLPSGAPLSSLPDWCHPSLMGIGGKIYASSAGPADRVIQLTKTGHSYLVGMSKVKFILLVDRSGGTWAITDDDRLVVKTKGSMTFEPFDGIPELVIDSDGEIHPAIYEDQNSRIWITTPEKIFVYYPKTGRHETLFPRQCSDDGIIGNSIYTTFQHRGGEFWIGSLYGATIITETTTPFAHWNNPLDSVNEMVYAILEASDGTVWAGARNSGLYHLDAQFNVLDFYPIKVEGKGSRVGGGVTSLLEDATGTIWVGTYDMGLFRLNPQKKQLAPVPVQPKNPGSLPTKKVFRTAIADRQGNIWFARCNGVSIWQPKLQRFKNLNLPGVSGYDQCRHIYALAEDQKGRIWIGEGLPTFYCYTPETGAWETFELPFPRIFIQAILEDKATGNLWLGTVNEGLVLYSPKERKVLAHYNKQGQEALSEITAIIPDGKGHLWLATANGIVKFDLKARTYKRYGNEDGLVCKFFMTDASFKSNHSGKLFFGCNDGFVAFHPDSVGIKEQPYNAPLIFTEAKIGGIKHYLAPNADELILQPGETNLEFNFSSLDFRYPLQKRYTFYLENLEKTWGDTLAQPVATYTQLRPGSYVFHLKGTDSYGNWLDHELALRLRVLPFWWQSLWFKTLAASSLVSLLALLGWYLLRKREAALRKTSQEALLAARRYQMLPHFVFNSLNAANEFLAEDDVAGANKFITNFAELMHLHLGELGQDFIPLSQEQHFLVLYLEVQHRRYRDKFDYHIAIEESLAAIDAAIPPMLIQPLVENAIQHGLRPLEKKGMLIVNFEKRNGELVCSVTDNGVGIRKAAELESLSSMHHHVGLENVKNRIALLNQLHQTAISFSMEDLKGEDGKASGTRAILRMRLWEYKQITTK